MKNKVISLLAAAFFSVFCAHAIDNVQFQMTDAFKEWESNKYSLFINLGLYTHLGGMWNGEPVTEGGGECIQSAARIFYDQYELAADEFDPIWFDAESIAQAAKKAGMRTIIFTAKHHDGFCMFDTESTDFNSADMLTSGRDFVKEMAEACKKEKLNFGLYYSLLDWHSPYASHMSSHNADLVSDLLHEQYKTQINELILNYGDISEFWFDMGSLTPEQSQEIYGIIKKYQPECMVSDHLGNDCYDFAVIPQIGSTQTDKAWQYHSPMFDGTFGWRSWEEKGNVADKAAEKLSELISTVSNGGNYVLNIGLNREGSIDKFEKEVLEQIGNWLSYNAEAIYGTSPSPFEEEFKWGCVTTKNKKMYIILNGEYPANGEIVIPALKSNKLLKCEGINIKRSKSGDIIKVRPEWFANKNDIKVLEADYNYSILPQNTMKAMRKGITLDQNNATIEHSLSGFDHCCEYSSETSYSWLINRTWVRNLHIFYTKESLGKEITITLDRKDTKVKLDKSVSAELNYLDIEATTNEMSNFEYCKISNNAFGTDLTQLLESAEGKWKECTQLGLKGIRIRPMQSVLIRCNIYATKAGYKMIEVEAGNGVEVILNGQKVVKHMNPYGTASSKESILLKLDKGNNEVVVRSFNRFETSTNCYIGFDPGQFLYRKKIRVGRGRGQETEILKLWYGPDGNPHSDGDLHNFVIFTRQE